MSIPMSHTGKKKIKLAVTDIVSNLAARKMG
jgi:hypothetical protein